ncbi:MAG: BON domain-containing protein [Acidimicrobiales bacterium]
MTDDAGEVEPIPEPYVLAHVHDALASDPRVVELGIDVVAAGGTLVLMGRVATAALREAAAQVAAEHAPGFEIRNDLELLDAVSPPAAPEQLR